MNKTTIRKSLSRSANGAEFINREQIKACMGWGDDRTKLVTDGLQFICLNRTRQYDVDEVAARIMQQVQ